MFLDQTLQRMIQRFEDEYPETKLFSGSPPTANGLPSPDPSVDASVLSGSPESTGAMETNDVDGYFTPGKVPQDDYKRKLSRTGSNTSLAAKEITNEEGRMHRFGQTVRREVLKPTGIDDNLHGTKASDSDPPHIAALRAKLEELRGEHIRYKVEREGADNVIREIGLNAQELLVMREEDPEGFAALQESQLAAQINAGTIRKDQS